ncbi:MAG TPA: hydrogen peroxide-dependent heme synthase [Terriglobales bacterium]|nr:hydrogen peroxide-dependent heme synthase [Terriglobales bacterium]
MTSNAQPQVAVTELQAVPLTIEGYGVLHQMMRFRWSAWRKLSEVQKAEIVREASTVLGEMEASGLTALFSVLGHKGDLMLVHFRNSFDELNSAELRLNKLAFSDYLRPTSSYLSVIELGLYESTIKLYRSLAERGVEPHSEQWNREVAETLERQKQAMSPRLFPKIPDTRYVCFYPMDRKRGEDKNWYTLSIEDRGRQLNEHGTVGRRYADTVRQIISGSIGFDDWEWGVDLFANDPLVYKKLIAEMRYDEVSAVFSNFGTFYVGIRCPASQLGALLEGNPPVK